MHGWVNGRMDGPVRAVYVSDLTSVTVTILSEVGLPNQRAMSQANIV